MVALKPLAPSLPPVSPSLASPGTTAQSFDYPVCSLGPRLSAATCAVAGQTQTPVELAAHHLLTLAAMAAQRKVVLELPTGHVRPLSCYFFTIAGAAERKSAAEEAIVDPVRLWQQEQRCYIDEKSLDFPDLFWTPPPRAANRYAGYRGQYGLFAQTSADVIADGRHRALETAGLCALWDGRSMIGSEAHVYLPRLSVHLVATPREAGRLLADLDLDDAGLLGRFLPVAPASLVGARRCEAPQAAAPAGYDDLCDRLLKSYAAPGGADDRILSLSQAAQALWFSFAAEVEAAMAPGRALAPVVGFAGRLPEHAARLAGVIALTEDEATSELSAEALQRGIDLARFYAWESLRIADVHAPAECAQADILLDWLQRNRPGQEVRLRDVCRGAPRSIRRGDDVYRLMRRLERQGLVKVAGDGAVPYPARRRAGVTYQWHVPAPADADQVSASVGKCRQ